MTGNLTAVICKTLRILNELTYAKTVRSVAGEPNKWTRYGTRLSLIDFPQTMNPSSYVWDPDMTDGREAIAPLTRTSKVKKFLKRLCTSISYMAAIASVNPELDLNHCIIFCFHSKCYSSVAHYVAAYFQSKILLVWHWESPCDPSENSGLLLSQQRDRATWIYSIMVTTPWPLPPSWALNERVENALLPLAASLLTRRKFKSILDIKMLMSAAVGPCTILYSPGCEKGKCN